jgi:hypothetical protein
LQLIDQPVTQVAKKLYFIPLESLYRLVGRIEKGLRQLAQPWETL